jgi:putative N6-adenine-specific DNA methylase
MEFTIIAKTLQGLEPVLAEEIRQIGGTEIEIHKRAVSFRGNKQLLYEANIKLRSALRILKPILEFKAANEEILYTRIKEYNWPALFSVTQSFAIDSTIYSEIFTHTGYPALKAKDAIADRFREEGGTRPSVDREKPDLQFNLHIQHDKVTFSLDSSGESLHKRGYRSHQHDAPMSEVLAAGLILLSGWNASVPFYDPMCGSGTLPIEAAMIATGIVPGLIRSHFAFKNWNDFDQGLYRQIILQSASLVIKSPVPIYGSDRSAQFIRMALAHAEMAKVERDISFSVVDFLRSDPPVPNGLVIMNPPYGERMDPGRINMLYAEIGNTLKRKYTGYTAWIFSSNHDAIKRVGLKPSVKHKLKNGPLDCYFHRFDIREGSYHRGISA